ncbi:MAG TPA: T9SS type A sorting domain-containing protein [Ignavibacteria bacterium]
MRQKLITILIFVLFTPLLLPAQWSTNPAINLTICDTTGEQVLPKIARTTDGGCYIGWFDSRSSGYAVYLQRLDINGNKLFPPNDTRLWADSGAVFKSLDPNSFASLNVITRDSNIYVYYAEILFGSTNGLIKAFKSDRNGVIGWGGSILTPGSYTGEKGRMSVTMNTAGMSMLAFSDSRIDAYGMYAQNINPNGSFGPPVGITPIGNIIPSKFELEQNYPNPFNPVTKIKFSITALSFPNAPIGNPATVLRVYDILGREIRTLVNENLQPGTYEVTFDAGNIPSGIYFYKLSSGVFSDTKRMLLIK